MIVSSWFYWCFARLLWQPSLLSSPYWIIIGLSPGLAWLFLFRMTSHQSVKYTWLRLLPGHQTVPPNQPFLVDWMSLLIKSLLSSLHPILIQLGSRPAMKGCSAHAQTRKLNSETAHVFTSRHLRTGGDSWVYCLLKLAPQPPEHRTTPANPRVEKVRQSWQVSTA